MTTINKKIEINKSRILCDLDQLLKIQHYELNPFNDKVLDGIL